MRALLGVGIGIAVWGIFFLVTGEIEPWDVSGGVFYLAVAHVLAGLAIVWIKPWWLALLSLWLGQVLYLLVAAPGPLLIVGAVLLIPYVAVSLISRSLVQAYLKQRSGNEEAANAQDEDN